MKRQSRKGFAAACQDGHDSPIALPEHACESFLILGAGVRAVTWVGMDPDPGELLWSSSRIDLLIKKFGDGFVIKSDGHRRTVLPDQHEVFYKQQIFWARDSESTDFGCPAVAQIQQFCPGPRTKSQGRFSGSPSRQAYSPAARSMLFHDHSSRKVH
jgi:hypothetical protein